MIKGLAGIHQLHVELASRAKIRNITETVTAKGIVLKVYNFDTVAICGDYTEVSVVAAFASEETARAALLEVIASIYQ